MLRTSFSDAFFFKAEKERERKVGNPGSSSPMPPMARGRPSWSQKLGSQYGSSRRVGETQVVEPSPARAHVSSKLESGAKLRLESRHSNVGWNCPKWYPNCCPYFLIVNATADFNESGEAHYIKLMLPSLEFSEWDFRCNASGQILPRRKPYLWSLFLTDSVSLLEFLQLISPTTGCF